MSLSCPQVLQCHQLVTFGSVLMLAFLARNFNAHTR